MTSTVCGNRSFQVTVMSLMRGQRRKYVSDILQAMPDAAVLQAVDGADKQKVMDALWHEHVQFHRLCRAQRGEWGALACFITRHRGFKMQSSDFQLLLEDDVEILPGFANMVRAVLGYHFCGTHEITRRSQVCSLGGRQRPCGRANAQPDIVQLGSYASISGIPTRSLFL